MQVTDGAGLAWDIEASAAVLARVRQRLRIDLGGGSGEALVRLLRTINRSRADSRALVECALGRQAEGRGIRPADLVVALERDGLLTAFVRAVLVEIMLVSSLTADEWQTTLQRAKLLKRKGG